jgi:DNA-binding beta-propeller fold protein YncE
VVSTVQLPRASAPYGIVLGSDNTALVALEASGHVVRVSSTGTVNGSVAVGAHPRHLALTADGSKLLVSRFISPFQAGEATGTIQTAVGGVAQGGEVRVVSPSTLAVAGTIRLQFSDKPDTTVSGRGVPNYLGAPAISPDGMSAWVPSKQDNIERGKLRDDLDLDFQNTVRAISSRINLSDDSEDYPARVDHDNSGVASAALYHPTGVYLFVALEASRQVAVLDPVGERELFRLNVGVAPQALAFDQGGTRLYVNNAMSRTISVFDLTPLIARGEAIASDSATLSPVQTEALTATVLRGKQLFYDARDTRLARDAYLSCAACHNDGDADGRTWDFTGFGEGLRNTVSLRGRGNSHGRVHWTANFDEIQDFETQIRTFAQGTGLMSDVALAVGTRVQPLGDPKSGLSADLDALAAYVTSLDAFDDTPYRTATGDTTAAADAGAIVFADRCASCHGGAGFTDSPFDALHDVGTIKPSSGTRLGATLTGFDSPTLRDVWATAPYLHDGSAATLEDAVQAHTGVNVPVGDLPNLVAYLLQIGGEEPGF